MTITTTSEVITMKRWNCRNCTHQNPESATHCFMCNHSRKRRRTPSSSEPKQHSSSQQHASLHDDQQPKQQHKQKRKHCSTCTYLNPETSSHCSMCGHSMKTAITSSRLSARATPPPAADGSTKGPTSGPTASPIRNPNPSPTNSSATNNDPSSAPTTEPKEQSSCEPSISPLGSQPPKEASEQDETSESITAPQHHTSEQQEQVLQGDETFLVGMTPQYWAHVPMLIMDLANLTLATGGINYYPCSYIPVSKCLLVGRIVAAKIVSDNSVLYVLDDGTGLMDVTAYNDFGDAYELPNLFPETDSEDDNVQDPHQDPRMLPLGTCVKVFGKIKNLAISHGRVVREISAQILEAVQESRGYNPEHEHWVKCATFQQKAYGGKSILEPLDCLETLGPHIQSQVRAKRRLPSANDTLQTWRVFGDNCQCDCSQSIKDSLLYCHCQATPLRKRGEQFHDAQFQYREALLMHLLQKQSKHAKKLVFGYQELKQQQQLFQVANMEQQQSPQMNSSKVKRKYEELLRATVRELVKDGILFHLDAHRDQYLLITREKVLEPYVRDELEFAGNINFVSLDRAPNYLKGVDREKFLYIKRCLLSKQKNSDKDKDDANPEVKRH